MLYQLLCCLLEYDLMSDSSGCTVKIQSWGVTPFPPAAWASVPHSVCTPEAGQCPYLILDDSAEPCRARRTAQQRWRKHLFSSQTSSFGLKTSRLGSSVRLWENLSDSCSQWQVKNTILSWVVDQKCKKGSRILRVLFLSKCSISAIQLW